MNSPNSTKAPEGMLQAAMDSLTPAAHFLIEREEVVKVVTAALEWWKQNPVEPTDEQIAQLEEIWYSEGHRENERFEKWVIVEWQRKLFVEEAVPQELLALMFLSPEERMPIDGVDGIEANRRILSAYNIGLCKK